MRPSDSIMALLGLATLCIAATLFDAEIGAGNNVERLSALRQQVAELKLTDLALFTEARYSRHLSQTDLHAPFQDHPFALEHFPTGSLLMPPQAATP